MSSDFKKSDRNKALGKRAILELMNKFEDQGYDPIVELIAIANDGNTPVKDRAKIHMHLSEFVHPKRRAVDIGSGDEDGIVVHVKDYRKKELDTFVDKDAMAKELADD
jgi:hypothetical protein